MSENKKFWIQTLIVPVILAVVGYFINKTLQEQQASLEKIKFADQIVNEAFDYNNPDKAYAMVKLVPLFIDDQAFADTIIKSINYYYLQSAKNAVLTSNDSVYRRISDAAKLFGTSSRGLQDSLTNNKTTSQAEKATHYEQTGLKYIQQGKLDRALENFKKSESTYPGFHSSYEISNLLREKVKQMRENGADSSKIQQEVQHEIKKKYAWQLHPKKK